MSRLQTLNYYNYHEKGLFLAFTYHHHKAATRNPRSKLKLTGLRLQQKCEILAGTQAGTAKRCEMPFGL